LNQPQVQNGILQISPRELKQKLDSGEDIFVLDVREPHEYQIANLGAKLIPLGDLPARVGELDRNREIVVHCKSGGRSQKASEFLAQNGFKNVQNLAGGITAWSNDVDPTIAKY
jgi:rhodanese-related sulfurtransferase